MPLQFRAAEVGWRLNWGWWEWALKLRAAVPLSTMFRVRDPRHLL